MLAGFLLANSIIIAVAAGLLLNRPSPPPLIQGVLLAKARPLDEFHLVDHHNQVFSNEDLKGHWNLVSYGFTTCPDICPTTLSQLGVVARQLEARGEKLRIIFYTVDHRRDTVQQLSTYVPFFHPDFIGLTHFDDANNPHLPFEQGLGIVAQLVPDTSKGTDPTANAYSVNHGVTLFLINPQGELQAIFEPENSYPGQHSFNPENIIRDYLAIREYLG